MLQRVLRENADLRKANEILVKAAVNSTGQRNTRTSHRSPPDFAGMPQKHKKARPG